jgi:hypothetical protein
MHSLSQVGASVNSCVIPPHVADYRRVPLPVETPSANFQSDWLPAPSRPFLDEWTAPLVYGAISQTQYHRSNLFKSVGFSVFPSSVRVHRDPSLIGTVQRPDTKRKEISGFSDKSRRRLRFSACNSFPALSSQFVLTYPADFPTDGAESKIQLNLFLTNFRKKFKGTPYLWVLEFQRRGAPHYHLFTPLPVTEANRLWLASTWVRIACGGSPAALRFHSNQRNFIPWDMGNGSYVCKYLEKERQKDVPDGYVNVGRFWGASRGLVPAPVYIDSQEMCAAYVDHISKPVTRAVRILVKFHENVTTWWDRDDQGRLYRRGKSRVRSGRTFYSFAIINARKIFLDVCKWYDRQEKGRQKFADWSINNSPGGFLYEQRNM